MDRMGSAGKKSINFKSFILMKDLFINVDYDGDIENYTKVGEEIDNCYKK